jgi:hypothetical protein
MQPGIVTSFIIGGMLLITLLAFNININTTTQETTLSTINQINIDNIAQVLTIDFKRIGYNDDDASNTFNNPVFSSSDAQRIEFRTNESTGSIAWFADTDSPVTSTTNPDDYYLFREENGTVTSYFPVVYFEITYQMYNNVTRTWEEVSDPANAKRFVVEFMLESGEPIRQKKIDGAEYHITAWKRTFTPHNINKPW